MKTDKSYREYTISSIPANSKVYYVSGSSNYSASAILSTSSKLHYGDTIKLEYGGTSSGRCITNMSSTGLSNISSSYYHAKSGYLSGKVAGNVTFSISIDWYLNFQKIQGSRHYECLGLKDGFGDITDVEIPSVHGIEYADTCYIERIAQYAFWGTGIQKLTVNNGIISSYAFGNCKSLRSVTLWGGSSVGVTTVESYAFSDCTALTYISFGEQVTSIGTSAFAGCVNANSAAIYNLSLWKSITGLNSLGGLMNYLTKLTVYKNASTIDKYENYISKNWTRTASYSNACDYTKPTTPPSTSGC